MKVSACNILRIFDFNAEFAFPKHCNFIFKFILFLISDKSVLFIYLSIMVYYKVILDFGKEIHQKCPTDVCK